MVPGDLRSKREFLPLNMDALSVGFWVRRYREVKKSMVCCQLFLSFHPKKQGVKVSGKLYSTMQHRLAAAWHVLRPGSLGSCLAQIYLSARAICGELQLVRHCWGISVPQVPLFWAGLV
jgi:hypothetical protein